MNSYLIQIANDLPQLRKVLSLTQKELAEELGISRPTLVKVEQSPDRLTKIMALGIYVVTNSYLQEDYERLQSLKNLTYTEKEDVGELLNCLGSFNTITNANITGVVSSTLSVNAFQAGLGFLGEGISGILKGIPSLFKGKDKEDNLKNIEITEDFPDMIQDFLQGIEQQIESKNKSCLEILNLNEWSTVEYLIEIEKGQLN